MTFEGLFSIAEQTNIITLFQPLRHKKAFSICEDNISAIIIDKRKIEIERELKKVYAEEMGHCMTRSFYPFRYCCDSLRSVNIMKAEHTAVTTSYRLQVPFCQLIRAMKKSSDDWEIAELLDVNIDVLHNAVEYYKCKGML